MSKKIIWKKYLQIYFQNKKIIKFKVLSCHTCKIELKVCKVAKYFAIHLLLIWSQEDNLNRNYPHSRQDLYLRFLRKWVFATNSEFLIPISYIFATQCRRQLHQMCNFSSGNFPKVRSGPLRHRRLKWAAERCGSDGLGGRAPRLELAGT